MLFHSFDFPFFQYQIPTLTIKSHERTPYAATRFISKINSPKIRKKSTKIIQKRTSDRQKESMANNDSNNHKNHTSFHCIDPSQKKTQFSFRFHCVSIYMCVRVRVCVCFCIQYVIFHITVTFISHSNNPVQRSQSHFIFLYQHLPSSP